MRTQMQKAETFRALHERPGAFIIPNPWDAGTAKLLAAMGFEALATTSLGLANMLGSTTVTRAAIIENCRSIAEATELPVSVDLENGGADDPRPPPRRSGLPPRQAPSVARSRTRAAMRDGLSMTSPLPSNACRRRSRPRDHCRFDSRLTARAENLLHGRNDLDDTIRRLQAFEAAGADVLYAPGVHDLPTIRTVISALRKPFNLVMGFADPTLTLAQLSDAGVKRISVGGALSRVALAAFLRCAREMKDKGSFTYVREMAPIKELRAAFASVTPP